MSDKISEAEVSMVLDTYMYLNYDLAKDGQTLKEIVEEMPSKIDVEEKYFKEYSVISKASQNPQIGELRIACQAGNMGYNEGTNAVTFVSEDNSKVYVIYRGTADGEWLDNGYGMTDPMTIQQNEAVSYFDEVVDTLGINEQQELYISGHSKGGNKVQFVTMESENAGLIDKCYSIDGQGHSDAAIERWRGRYSEEEYQSRVEKIYAINGQNDFVSVLGNSIVLASHVSFLETPADLTDFAGYHDITRMFATREQNEKGKTVLNYNGRKNNYVLNRGELGNYVSDLSENIMSLPAMVREGSAVTLMQVAEVFNMGRVTGVNNEHVTLSDFVEFFKTGLPTIIRTLVYDEEGKRLVRTVFNKEEFSMKTNQSDSLEVDYEALRYSAAKLKSASERIEDLLNEIQGTANSIPLIVDGMNFGKPYMEDCVARLKILQLKFARMSSVQEEVARIYGDYDLRAKSII